MTLAQTSIFDFEPRPASVPSARWLCTMGDDRRTVYRTDAEALCGSLGSIPTKGLWLRCMEVDHKASYNAWCPWASAKVWWQTGMGAEVLVDHSGRAEAWLNPWPHRYYYENGRQTRPTEHYRIVSAVVEGDVLRVTLDGMGNWLAEVHEDDEAKWCDVHPYDPAFDLEHFAIECYRKGLPESMFDWRGHYVYGTPALRPFYHAMSAEECKRLDLVGPIPGSVLPNMEFAQVCECAEAVGVSLRIERRVPALENLAMHPAERRCSNCLRKGSSNIGDECWKDGQMLCSRYMWDRRTPASPYRKPTKKQKACMCEDEDEEGCE